MNTDSFDQIYQTHFDPDDPAEMPVYVPELPSSYPAAYRQVSGRNKRLGNRNKRKVKEKYNMESNVKELNMEELEQVNGGSLILLTASAVISVAGFAAVLILGSN